MRMFVQHVASRERCECFLDLEDGNMLVPVLFHLCVCLQLY